MIACIYNALLWGMLISVLLSQSEWLDMRINTGIIFFAIALVLALLFALTKKFNTFRMSLLSLVVTSSGLFYILGLEGLCVIPASIIREGLMQSKLSFHVINIALIAVIITGLLLTLFTAKHERQ